MHFVSIFIEMKVNESICSGQWCRKADKMDIERKKAGCCTMGARSRGNNIETESLKKLSRELLGGYKNWKI